MTPYEAYQEGKAEQLARLKRVGDLSFDDLVYVAESLKREQASRILDVERARGRLDAVGLRMAELHGGS